MVKREQKIEDYINEIDKLWRSCKFKAARTLFIKYNIEITNLIDQSSKISIANGLLFFIKNFKIFIFKTNKNMSLLTDTNYCKTSWRNDIFYTWNMYISPEIMLCIIHNFFLK